jgi:hypothetical protein
MEKTSMNLWWIGCLERINHPLQWAQVILMIELSINPRARLMSLLEYSRPIGTDKRKRAFVVSRKARNIQKYIWA